MDMNAMIKKLLLVLCVLLNSLMGSAQVKMADVFRTMPDSLLLLLSNNDRMDLLDFVESGMTARVTNRLDAKTTLDKLTDDFLHLTVTPLSVMEMKLLPLNDTLQAVAVVKTVAGPAKDSVVRLYLSDWSRQLNLEDHIQYPDAQAYWTKGADEMSDEEKQLLAQLDPVLIQVVLSPENKSFVFRRSYGMLPKTDQPQAEKLLKDVAVDWKE